MYNRYIRSEADEEPFVNRFVPVPHADEEYRETDVQAEEVREQTQAVVQSEYAEHEQNAEQCDGARGDNDKKAGSFLAGLLDPKKINADTLIVLGIALFILCDNKDQTGDVLLILAVLILLGF